MNIQGSLSSVWLAFSVKAFPIFLYFPSPWRHDLRGQYLILQSYFCENCTLIKRTLNSLLQRHLCPCHRSLVSSVLGTGRMPSKAHILGDSSGRETISRVTGGMKVKVRYHGSSRRSRMVSEPLAGRSR